MNKKIFLYIRLYQIYKLTQVHQQFPLEVYQGQTCENKKYLSYQASLFLNGNGAGENSHMSVYIKLLPGEFDGILRWPFKHTVSFTMLDQTPEKKSAVNVVESFLPDPSWPNFQRPAKQPDQLGFGFPKFVPHELLTARNYIKDDTLFLKIRIELRVLMFQIIFN